jgi:CHASE2 domain-containing sensor protein
LAHGYWGQTRLDVLAYIRQDLALPLFAAYDVCDAWTSYTAGQRAVFGLDLPANLAEQLLHAAITGAATCLDLATPRGHLIAAPFVFLFWLLPAITLRRLAQRRRHRPWRAPLLRALAFLGILLFPLGVLSVIASIVCLFFPLANSSLKLIGLAFWCLYPAALAAERLRTPPTTNG